MLGHIVALALVLLISVGCGVHANPSDGEKIGTVIRVTKSGLLCKTWEATIIRGGLVDGSGSAGGAQSYFTIESAELLEQFQEALTTQREVIITYQQEALYASCRSDAGSFAKSLKYYEKPTS